ncbi:MAG: hypothetical protein QXI60_05925 [Thermofilaceae archaeon]
MKRFRGVLLIAVVAVGLLELGLRGFLLQRLKQDVKGLERRIQQERMLADRFKSELEAVRREGSYLALAEELRGLSLQELPSRLQQALSGFQARVAEVRQTAGGLILVRIELPDSAPLVAATIRQMPTYLHLIQIRHSSGEKAELQAYLLLPPG